MVRSPFPPSGLLEAACIRSLQEMLNNERVGAISRILEPSAGGSPQRLGNKASQAWGQSPGKKALSAYRFVRFSLHVA